MWISTLILKIIALIILIVVTQICYKNTCKELNKYPNIKNILIIKISVWLAYFNGGLFIITKLIPWGE